VPDATGLELIAQELRESEGAESAVLDTVFFRGRGTLVVEPGRIRSLLSKLRESGYRFLASVHGVDYFPHEPRFGVLYELLDMSRVDRLTVKALLDGERPAIDSVTPDTPEGAGWPTANHQEREIFDMLGVEFRGHPDPRRILMPEDYEGHPQRRDFPIGGEPVIFTYNERDPLGDPE